jgi:hypothetical protein
MSNRHVMDHSFEFLSTTQSVGFCTHTMFMSPQYGAQLLTLKRSTRRWACKKEDNAAV